MQWFDCMKLYSNAKQEPPQMFNINFLLVPLANKLILFKMKKMSPFRLQGFKFSLMTQPVIFSSLTNGSIWTMECLLCTMWNWYHDSNQNMYQWGTMQYPLWSSSIRDTILWNAYW